MKPSFDTFDHTADVGLHIRAPTPDQLLGPAADALYFVIGELYTTGPTQTMNFDLEATERSLLLRDYMGELLVLFEQERKIVTSTDRVRFDDNRLVATVQVASVDDQRSTYHHEVKAITYHALEIDEVEGGHEATVILDI